MKRGLFFVFSVFYAAILFAIIYFPARMRLSVS